MLVVKLGIIWVQVPDNISQDFIIDTLSKFDEAEELLDFPWLENGQKVSRNAVSRRPNRPPIVKFNELTEQLKVVNCSCDACRFHIAEGLFLLAAVGVFACFPSKVVEHPVSIVTHNRLYQVQIECSNTNSLILSKHVGK